MANKWKFDQNPNNLLFYSQFSPLNVGNRSLELCSFQIFWGNMPPDTPWKRELLIWLVTLFKSAGYFNFYWNPCYTHVQDTQSCATFTGNPVLCPLKMNAISIKSLITSVTTLWYITWMYKDELNSFTIWFTIIITLTYSLHFRTNSSWDKIQSIQWFCNIIYFRWCILFWSWLLHVGFWSSSCLNDTVIR